MIKASNINKSYGSLQVLKDVSIEIPAGKVVSIVGPSGAGKSTLLHILGTLDTPDSGSVVYNDVDITSLNQKKLDRFRNQNIGFVFQFHNLLPEFTALENVCLPGFISETSENEVKEKATKLLTELGLQDRLNHKPTALSGGEQQRVSMARALINSPSVILADEPSGNLDSKNADQLHDLIFDLRDKFNQTFVIVTHNDKLAEGSDIVRTMTDGKLQQMK